MAGRARVGEVPRREDDDDPGGEDGRRLSDPEPARAQRPSRGRKRLGLRRMLREVLLDVDVPVEPEGLRVLAQEDPDVEVAGQNLVALVLEGAEVAVAEEGPRLCLVEAQTP